MSGNVPSWGVDIHKYIFIYCIFKLQLLIVLSWPFLIPPSFSLLACSLKASVFVLSETSGNFLLLSLSTAKLPYPEKVFGWNKEWLENSGGSQSDVK